LDLDLRARPRPKPKPKPKPSDRPRRPGECDVVGEVRNDIFFSLSLLEEISRRRGDSY